MSVIARRRGPILAAAIVVLASTLYIGLAVVSRGFPAATVQLNDGSVWITQESQSGEIARLNQPIDQLDGGVVPVGPTFDVLQSGYTVLSYSTGSGVLRNINAATLGFGPVTKVPSGSSVSLGQQTVAISSGGDAWIEQANALATPSRGSPELDKLGTKPASYSVVVGTDGVVHAYSSGDQMLSSISLGPTGSLSSSAEQVAVGSPSDHVVVSAVGSTPVILDTSTGSVVIPGQGSVAIPTNASDPAPLQFSSQARRTLWCTCRRARGCSQCHFRRLSAAHLEGGIGIRYPRPAGVCERLRQRGVGEASTVCVPVRWGRSSRCPNSRRIGAISACFPRQPEDRCAQ